jgi:nifR3 family TIM-barrel protein
MRNQITENQDAGETWNIGNLKIIGKVILAPMEGYTDQPFRQLCGSYGSSTLHVSEFINAIDIIHGHPYIVKNRVRHADNESPMAFQIFDNDPARIVKAAHQLLQYEPDLIDINMGCSVKKVSNRGAGAGLLRTPQKIATVFTQLVKNLPVPVTGKIRLGWDETSRNYLEIARIIEDCGGAALAVHGRTRDQGYSGRADWDAIAEIKQTIQIPVIGNGDLTTLAEAKKMQAYAKCDAVMIGRAAIGNPWLFAGISKMELLTDELLHIIQIHLNSMVDFYGETIAVVQFRKHAVSYLSHFHLTGDERRRLLTTTTHHGFIQALVDLRLPQRI